MAPAAKNPTTPSSSRPHGMYGAVDATAATHDPYPLYSNRPYKTQEDDDGQQQHEEYRDSRGQNNDGDGDDGLAIQHVINHLDVFGEGRYTGPVLVETQVPHGSNGCMEYFRPSDSNNTEDANTTHQSGSNGESSSSSSDQVEVIKYEGDWKFGMWHGQGMLLFANGDVYIGQFEEDARHGTGTYLWKDGRSYQGEFISNARQGKGTFTWPDGATYVGQFVKGQRNGSGKYIFPDGNTYDGNWKDGQYHGYG